MVSNTMWKNSIGGSKGSASTDNHSITLNDGNLNAQAHDQKGRQAAEPNRRATFNDGPNPLAGKVRGMGGSGHDAKNWDKTAEADKLARSGKVKI
jgi:hypothetical protein